MGETIRYVSQLFVIGKANIKIQAGLEACGLKTAVALAHAGFGTKLFAGLEQCHTPGAAAAFLAEWRLSLADELNTNRLGLLVKRQPTLAKSIPPSFPSLKIINFYLHPVTSQSQGGSSKVLTITRAGPNLPRLALFAEKYFQWGTVAGILRQFSSTIFPGLAIRQLVRAACARDRGLHNPGYSMLGALISNTRRESRTSEGHHPEARAHLVVDGYIIDSVRKGIKGANDTDESRREADAWVKVDAPALRVWLPLAMIGDIEIERLGTPGTAPEIHGKCSSVFPPTTRPLSSIQQGADPKPY